MRRCPGKARSTRRERAASRSARAFTLIELLTAITIIAILAAIIYANFGTARRFADRTRCMAGMRGTGAALLDYAGDNNGELPGRTMGFGLNGEPVDKWPKQLSDRGLGISGLVDPGDPTVTSLTLAQLVDNASNHTSFFINGFNDVGALTDPNIRVRLVALTDPVNTILLGQKNRGSGQHYMDLLQGANGNQADVLDKTAFGPGSVYVFADGSSRFLVTDQDPKNAKRDDVYKDEYWMVDKSMPVPHP